MVFTGECEPFTLSLKGKKREQLCCSRKRHLQAGRGGFRQAVAMSLMLAAPSSLLTTGQPAGLEGGAGTHPVPGKRWLAKVTPWNLTRDLGSPEPLLRGTCSETWDLVRCLVSRLQWTFPASLGELQPGGNLSEGPTLGHAYSFTTSKSEGNWGLHFCGEWKRKCPWCI